MQILPHRISCNTGLLGYGFEQVQFGRLEAFAGAGIKPQFTDGFALVDEGQGQSISARRAVGGNNLRLLILPQHNRRIGEF